MKTKVLFLLAITLFLVSCQSVPAVFSDLADEGIIPSLYQKQTLREKANFFGYVSEVEVTAFLLRLNNEELAGSAEEVVPEAVVEVPAAPNCQLTKGKQIFFGEPDDDGYYHLSSDMPELKKYEGCKFIAEGRVNLGSHDHHIWAFSGNNWSLRAKEVSLYGYPYNWNMTDFSATKPPIAAEFVAAKREIQEHEDTEGFNSSMWIHPEKGVSLEIPGGKTIPGVTLPDNGNFTEPKRISVHGVWQDDSDTYLASIGAERTISVASIDGKVVYWEDGKDRIEYNSISAYTIPSDWTLAQAKAWGKTKFGSVPTLLR